MSVILVLDIIVLWWFLIDNTRLGLFLYKSILCPHLSATEA